VSARAIRPVFGVPGSSFAGAAVLDNVEFASIAPGGKLALAVRGGETFLLDTSDWRVVASGTATDIAAWNEKATAVVAADSASGTLLQWTADGARTELAPVPPPVSALAIDSSGERVYAAVAGKGIYEVTAGSARLLTALHDASAILIRGAEAWVADRAGNAVYALRDGALTLLAGESMGIDSPVGIALVRGRLLVAGRARIVAINLDRVLAPEHVALEFEPSRLDVFGNDLFLMNDGGAVPWQLLDASRDPAVFFVPAVAQEE
jgi:hypothetical protein